VAAPTKLAVVTTGSPPAPVSAFFSACELGLGVVGSEQVAERWEDDSALDGFSVGAIAAHLYTAIRRLESALAQPEPTAPRVVARIADFYGPNRIDDSAHLDDAFHVAIRAEGAERAGQGPGTVAEELEALIGRLRARLAGQSMTRLVPVLRIEGGAARLSDYLRTRVVELLVHADDLAASVGIEIEPPPDTVSSALTVFLELAGARSGDVAVLRAFTRREQTDPETLRVL
jgi:uncharacterized protein (TIGR03083 family)